MRIFVTGGTGFIGSNLTVRLLTDGHEVMVTGHDAEQTLPGFQGKVLQPSFLGLDWGAIGPVDILYHQAAINNTMLADEREMFRANVEAAEALFRHVVDRGCRRIVYASTTAVYGNGPVPYREDQALQPRNAYARSKATLDASAMAFARAHPDVVVVGLRYCNVYGPRENHKGRRASMIWQLAQSMHSGNPRLFTDGEQKRDYIHVDDVVRANLLAAQATESTVVNCGSGIATSFNDLVALLNEVLGVHRITEYFENPSPVTYQDHTLCDMTRAREVLGFVPEVSIRNGVRAYAESGSLLPA